MATIEIHQDLYGYEKKYKGMTKSQLVFAAAGIAAGLAVAWAANWCLGLPTMYAVFFAVVAGAAVALLGMLKYRGIVPFYVALLKMRAMNRRGHALVAEVEEAKIERSELDRETRRSIKKKGWECGR